LTAYTTDYSIGDVCCHVNKAYATKQGYAFRADKMSYEDMLGAIHPRTHCTWYKARMVLEELRRSLQEKKIDDTTAGKEDRIKLIMWIDADAMVINHDVAVQDVVAAALAGDGHGSGVHASALPARPITWSALPDLIVSADMSPKSVYPLNAGVLLVKVTGCIAVQAEEGQVRRSGSPRQQQQQFTATNPTPTATTNDNDNDNDNNDWMIIFSFLAIKQPGDVIS
jgi:hypothetical protein